MALNISIEEGPTRPSSNCQANWMPPRRRSSRSAIEKVAAAKPKRLVLFMSELTFMASAGLRVLIFARQKMGAGVALYVIGAQGPVLSTLTMSGFHHSVHLQDIYAPE